MTPSEDRVLNKLREEIARIVDPEAWNWKPLPRAADEGPASKKAFDEQDRSDGQAMAARRANALAKAEQIIAAWNRRAGPSVERLREALGQAEDWFREYADLHRAKCSADGDAKAQTNTERADFCAREALALPVGNISARDLAPQPEPLTVPETPRHADALQDRIGERIADEVEKACHGRQTNCEQAAADILAMLKGGAS